MVLYLDTSALAKRYLAETGSRWIQMLAHPASGNTIAIVNITRVEIGAAIARRQRDPRNRMSLTDREMLIRLFDLHVTQEYLVIDIKPAVIDDAYRLTHRHQLRGYDAVQLAAALALNSHLASSGVPELILIANDAELLTAAKAEGLTTDDPGVHP